MKKDTINGSATLRDILDLQKCMDEKLDKLNEKVNGRMTQIEIKSAKIATTITVAGGLVGFAIAHFIPIPGR